MNSKTFILAVIFQTLISLPVSAKPADSLDMRLSTYKGQARSQHHRNFPLVLKMIISTMGEPVTIKESAPIKDFIRFFIVEKNAEPLPVDLKPMADCTTQKETIVDKNNSIFLEFGMEPERFNNIKTKTFNLVAEIKMPGATSTTLKSNSIEIALLDAENLPIKSLEAIQNNYEAGGFYLQQKDYAKTEQYAKKLESVATSLAWELRGDAFLSQGKKVEAKNAYRKSLKSSDLILPDQMREITAAKLHELSAQKDSD